MFNSSDQLLGSAMEIAESATKKFNEGNLVIKKEKIPLTDEYPMTTNTWWKIDDVVCVYIDMKNSTQLSAVKDDKEMARIYQYFTETAVRVLDDFGSSYIDVRGDGAFGLFNKNKLYHALSSAVTFKTMVSTIISPNINLPSGMNSISSHIGIDQGDVLVKRVGIKTAESKTDKHNEVWAGKPVNMAAKLASLGGNNEVLISERVMGLFLVHKADRVLKSCGCNSPNGVKTLLWESMPVDNRFDFNKAWKLRSDWCTKHGQSYCSEILDYDNIWTKTNF